MKHFIATYSDAIIPDEGINFADVRHHVMAMDEDEARESIKCLVREIEYVVHAVELADIENKFSPPLSAIMGTLGCTHAYQYVTKSVFVPVRNIHRRIILFQASSYLGAYGLSQRYTEDPLPYGIPLADLSDIYDLPHPVHRYGLSGTHIEFEDESDFLMASSAQ